MSGVRLLVIDLAGETRQTLQNDIREAFPQHQFQFGYNRLTRSGTCKAASRVSVIMRSFAPDLVLLILSNDWLSSIADICSGFQELYPLRPWIAVIGSDAQLQQIQKYNPVAYLTIPYNKLDLLVRIAPWIDRIHPQAAQIGEVKKRLSLEHFVGESSAVAKLLEDLDAVAKTKAGVLIQGETGTGKELCAKAIHSLSKRSSKHLVTINCGELRGELVEDTLFGHIAGAFTGAKHARAGALQEAHGGTLFLDEINSLPAPGQAILMRVIQEHEFRALGADEIQKADFRIIAATNVDLSDMIAAKSFREDLYHRVAQVRLRVPPLRERPRDIVLLAQHFLTQFVAEHSLTAKTFSQAAMEKLVHYHWPGNVRELRNLVSEVVCFSKQPIIRPEEIPLPEVNDDASSYKAAKARVVGDWLRLHMKKQLAVAEGNASQAARAGKQDPRAFRAAMRKCGMERKSWPPYSRPPQ